ncbi:MAG: hypothetical protein ACPG3X_04215 [Opitutales bacterium]
MKRSLSLKGILLGFVLLLLALLSTVLVHSIRHTDPSEEASTAQQP